MPYRFKSITEFENFVQSVRASYLDKMRDNEVVSTNEARFLVQLNTELHDLGLIIAPHDPAPPEDSGNIRAVINYRLLKSGAAPRTLERFARIIQDHVDSINETGA